MSSRNPTVIPPTFSLMTLSPALRAFASNRSRAETDCAGAGVMCFVLKAKSIRGYAEIFGMRRSVVHRGIIVIQAERRMSDYLMLNWILDSGHMEGGKYLQNHKENKHAPVHDDFCMGTRDGGGGLKLLR